jgi:ectoine hydroxylase-related dioxygenase (phytanoyl-CoA dioxygenase family)
MPVETAVDSRASHDVRSRYERDGFVFPFAIFSAREVRSLRELCFAFRNERGAELADDRRTAQMLVHNQTHLVLDWVAELSRTPAIVDLAQLMIGPDIALWHSQWMVKMPGEEGIANAPLPWHQDAVNFAFDPSEAVTAWIALSEATSQNGAMQFVPGSHTGGLFAYESNARDERAQVTRGPIVGVDTSSAVDVCLHPGEVSIHHPFLVHASGINVTGDARVAILFRYIPTDVISRGPHRVEGTLIRGTAPDSFRVLDPERSGDRAELQRENLAHMQANAAVVGY